VERGIGTGGIGTGERRRVEKREVEWDTRREGWSKGKRE
jgi:hypothetical protein